MMARLYGEVEATLLIRRSGPVDVIAAHAVALGAFDAEHVELAFDVAEDERCAGHPKMLRSDSVGLLQCCYKLTMVFGTPPR
jgi:hypothetical protein